MLPITVQATENKTHRLVIDIIIALLATESCSFGDVSLSRLKNNTPEEFTAAHTIIHSLSNIYLIGLSQFLSEIPRITAIDITYLNATKGRKHRIVQKIWDKGFELFWFTINVFV